MGKVKEIIKSKHSQRLFGLIVVLVVLAGAVFIFSNPLLAPESGVDMGKKSQQNDNANLGTFNQPVDNAQFGANVKAGSFLVFDEVSGKTIASRNPQSSVAIASLTKLMTAYVVTKYGHRDDVWGITSASTENINPVLGLKVGDRVKISDLLNSMLIGSANDAAKALGQYIGTQKNVSAIELMNSEAKKLGMNSTHYENPIGFDSEQNYSTAEDLQKLVLALQPIEFFKDIDKSTGYSFTSENGNSYYVKATNTLIKSDPEIFAIKTGFTDEAKGAMITAIHHKDRKFVIIVLDSQDREGDTKLLKAQLTPN